MVTDRCQDFEELLVDLADGELTGVEALRVCEHLAQCSGCRNLLGRLNRSLVCARRLWDELQEDGADATQLLSTANRNDHRQGHPDLVVASVTATIVVAAVLLIVLPLFSVIDVETTDVGRNEIAAADDQKPAVAPRVEEELDIERLLRAREQAARLGAVVDILAEVPELADVHRQTREYLSLYYSDP